MPITIIGLIIGVAFIIVGAVGVFRSTKRKKQIRQKLGDFLKEGQLISRKCYENNTEAPSKEADQWCEKVYSYLNDTLGSDYSERFQSHQGLSPGFTTLSGEHAHVEAWLRTRLARLNEFLAELTSLN